MFVSMKEYEAQILKAREDDERFWKGVRYLAWINITTTPNIKNKPHSPQNLFRLASEEIKAERVDITNDIKTALSSIGLL